MADGDNLKIQLCELNSLYNIINDAIIIICNDILKVYRKYWVSHGIKRKSQGVIIRIINILQPTRAIKLKNKSFNLLSKSVLFFWKMLRKLVTVNGSFSKKTSLMKVTIWGSSTVAEVSYVMLSWFSIRKR